MTVTFAYTSIKPKFNTNLSTYSPGNTLEFRVKLSINTNGFASP